MGRGDKRKSLKMRRRKSRDSKKNRLEKQRNGQPTQPKTDLNG